MKGSPVRVARSRVAAGGRRKAPAATPVVPPPVPPPVLVPVPPPCEVATAAQVERYGYDSGCHTLSDWWVTDGRVGGAPSSHDAGWSIGRHYCLVRMAVRDDDGGHADCELPVEHAVDVSYCRVAPRVRMAYGGPVGEEEDRAWGVAPVSTTNRGSAGDGGGDGGDGGGGGGDGGGGRTVHGTKQDVEEFVHHSHHPRERRGYAFSRALVTLHVTPVAASCAADEFSALTVVVRATVYGRPGMPAGARQRLAPACAAACATPGAVFHPPRIVLRHGVLSALCLRGAGGAAGAAAPAWKSPVAVALDTACITTASLRGKRTVATCGRNGRGERVVMSLVEERLPPGTLLCRGATPLFLLQGFNYTTMQYFATEKSLGQLAASSNALMQQMARMYGGGAEEG